jgi:diamine N-acetyltransferase
MPLVIGRTEAVLAIWNEVCLRALPIRKLSDRAFNLVIMILRPAIAEDIPRIVALERTPGARQFVGQWSEERHRAALRGGDTRYLLSESEISETTVNEKPPGTLEAYVILRGLSEDSGAIELKRIVVAVPERGLGRKILSEVIRMAFEEFHAHRLFLDVYEDNARARHLYESLGFVYEGTMRDAARRGETYCNLRLMSMLEEEYERDRVQGLGNRE